MHTLTAKLFDKKVSVFFLGKTHDNVPLMLPDDRRAVSLRNFEVVVAAEILMPLKVCAHALVGVDGDPVRETSLRCSLYARLAMRHVDSLFTKCSHAQAAMNGVPPVEHPD